MLLLGIFIRFLLRDWEMPLEWIRHAADDLAGRELSIRTSIGLSAVAGNAGGFLGVSLGALLSHRQGGFNPGGPGWKRVLRSLAGLVLLAILYGAFDWVSPDPARDLLSSLWRFSGFFLISLSAIFLLPHLFKRFRL
jgi:hypothetical protein